mmetsp:Transcript_1152/g.2259  ORF Transcript_1152/g.2259 Transcript_1152/m.2259 type:complete len:255 (+) Transcript_1152:286-1050(+)
MIVCSPVATTQEAILFGPKCHGSRSSSRNSHRSSELSCRSWTSPCRQRSRCCLESQVGWARVVSVAKLVPRVTVVTQDPRADRVSRGGPDFQVPRVTEDLVVLPAKWEIRDAREWRATEVQKVHEAPTDHRALPERRGRKDIQERTARLDSLEWRVTRVPGVWRRRVRRVRRALRVLKDRQERWVLLAFVARLVLLDGLGSRVHQVWQGSRVPLGRTLSKPSLDSAQVCRHQKESQSAVGFLGRIGMITRRMVL